MKPAAATKEPQRQRNYTHEIRLVWRRRVEGGGSADAIRRSVRWTTFLRRRNQRANRVHGYWIHWAQDRFQSLQGLPADWSKWVDTEMLHVYDPYIHAAWAQCYQNSSSNSSDAATELHHEDTELFERPISDDGEARNSEWASWANEEMADMEQLLHHLDFVDPLQENQMGEPDETGLSDNQSESETVQQRSDSEDSIPGLIGSSSSDDDSSSSDDDDDAVHSTARLPVSEHNSDGIPGIIASSSEAEQSESQVEENHVYEMAEAPSIYVNRPKTNIAGCLSLENWNRVLESSTNIAAATMSRSRQMIVTRENAWAKLTHKTSPIAVLPAT